VAVVTVGILALVVTNFPMTPRFTAMAGHTGKGIAVAMIDGSRYPLDMTFGAGNAGMVARGDRKALIMSAKIYKIPAQGGMAAIATLLELAMIDHPSLANRGIVLMTGGTGGRGFMKFHIPDILVTFSTGNHGMTTDKWEIGPVMASPGLLGRGKTFLIMAGLTVGAKFPAMDITMTIATGPREFGGRGSGFMAIITISPLMLTLEGKCRCRMVKTGKLEPFFAMTALAIGGRLGQMGDPIRPGLPGRCLPRPNHSCRIFLARFGRLGQGAPMIIGMAGLADFGGWPITSSAKRIPQTDFRMTFFTLEILMALPEGPIAVSRIIMIETQLIEATKGVATLAGQRWR
jgi:hypothetical protein